MPKLEGSRPKSASIYIEQIPSAHVINNIYHHDTSTYVSKKSTKDTITIGLYPLLYKYICVVNSRKINMPNIDFVYEFINKNIKHNSHNQLVTMAVVYIMMYPCSQDMMHPLI